VEEKHTVSQPVVRRMVDHHLFDSWTAVSIICTVAALWAMAEAAADVSCQAKSAGATSSHMLINIMIVLFVVFNGEILLRLLSRSPHGFWESWYNRFDVFVWFITVWALLIEGIWINHNNPIDTGSTKDCLILYGVQWKWLGLLIFRCFGLLRVSLWEREYTVLWWFKETTTHCGINMLAKIESFNRNIVETAVRTIFLLYYTSCLVFLLTYVFAIGGVMLLNNSIEEVNAAYEDPPVNEAYTNYRSLGQAMIGMFQIMMENNWNDQLYTTAMVYGAAAVCFFVSYFIVNGYFFLNIFTVIVLNSLGSDNPTSPGWMQLTIPHGEKLYKLQRHPRQSALELHTDLTDSTKAELLRQCVETPPDEHAEGDEEPATQSILQRALTSDQVEIEEEPQCGCVVC